MGNKIKPSSSESQGKPEFHPASEVITNLYSAVADNKNMPSLLNAWDSFVDDIVKTDPQEGQLWQSFLNEHFEQAGTLVFVNKPSLAEKKQAFVDRQAFPAILFNVNFCLIAKNRHAEKIWPCEFDSDISSAILPPFDRERIVSFDSRDISSNDPVLVSLNIGSNEFAQVVMAIVHPVEFSSGDGATTERLFVLRIATPRWYPELGRMLSKTYGLTEAELEIAKGLYQNQSLNMIAEERGRSIRTVRTQLANVFEKTSASSQTELIGMISNLCQILESSDGVAELTVNQKLASIPHSDVKVMSCLSPEGHQLSFAVYGDPQGRPVLSLQPTTPPEMTKRFRQSAVQHGLRIIAPYKPGSGQSSSRSYQYSPKLAASDYQLILEFLGVERASVIGICSGGIYALEFAQRYPKMVEQIVLVESGVPLQGMDDFAKMSAAPRRTFIAARYFSRILLTPHRLIAKEFHQSVEGEKRVVDYFFSGSPLDQDLVKNHPEFYDLTRNIISYSFEDLRHLVYCVCLWAGDWREQLIDVSNQHSLSFVHGEQNNVFMWDAVKKFADERTNVEVKPISGCSQLGIFVDPDSLLETI
ncbi:MAG: alpha/beta fold hydrolase [Pseudomonadota bacterium]